jgi:hypothetical protein
LLCDQGVTGMGWRVSGKSLDDARHPAIGKDLATRLACRTVCNLVIVERDASDVRTAPGTGTASAAMNREPLAELRGKPTCAFTLTLQTFGQHLARRFHQSRTIVTVEPSERRIGRKPGVMQYVVSKPPSDACDGSLVPQHRVDVTAIVAVPYQDLEFRAEGVGAKAR